MAHYAPVLAQVVPSGGWRPPLGISVRGTLMNAEEGEEDGEWRMVEGTRDLERVW